MLVCETIGALFVVGPAPASQWRRSFIPGRPANTTRARVRLGWVCGPACRRQAYSTATSQDDEQSRRIAALERQLREQTNAAQQREEEAAKAEALQVELEQAKQQLVQTKRHLTTKAEELTEVQTLLTEQEIEAEKEKEELKAVAAQLLETAAAPQPAVPPPAPAGAVPQQGVMSEAERQMLLKQMEEISYLRDRLDEESEQRRQLETRFQDLEVGAQAQAIGSGGGTLADEFNELSALDPNAPAGAGSLMDELAGLAGAGSLADEMNELAALDPAAQLNTSQTGEGDDLPDLPESTASELAVEAATAEAAAERAAREQAERLVAAAAERERAALAKAEQLAAESVARERAARAELERLGAEAAARELAARDKAELEARGVAASMAAEREAREAADRRAEEAAAAAAALLAAERQAEAERVAEMLAAERGARLKAEQAAAEAQQQAEVERLARASVAEQAERERAAREQAERNAAAANARLTEDQANRRKEVDADNEHKAKLKRLHALFPLMELDAIDAVLGMMGDDFDGTVQMLKENYSQLEAMERGKKDAQMAAEMEQERIREEENVVKLRNYQEQRDSIVARGVYKTDATSLQARERAKAEQARKDAAYAAQIQKRRSVNLDGAAGGGTSAASYNPYAQQGQQGQQQQPAPVSTSQAPAQAQAQPRMTLQERQAALLKAKKDREQKEIEEARKEAIRRERQLRNERDRKLADESALNAMRQRAHSLDNKTQRTAAAPAAPGGNTQPSPLVPSGGSPSIALPSQERVFEARIHDADTLRELNLGRDSGVTVFLKCTPLCVVIMSGHTAAPVKEYLFQQVQSCSATKSAVHMVIRDGPGQALTLKFSCKTPKNVEKHVQSIMGKLRGSLVPPNAPLFHRDQHHSSGISRGASVPSSRASHQPAGRSSALLVPRWGFGSVAVCFETRRA